MKYLVLLSSLLIASAGFAKVNVSMKPANTQSCTEANEGKELNWVYGVNTEETAQEVTISFFTDFSKCVDGKRQMTDLSEDVVVDLFGETVDAFQRGLPVVTKDQIRNRAAYIKMTFNKDEIFEKKSSRTYTLKLSQDWSGISYPWTLKMSYNQGSDQTKVSIQN